MKFLLAYYKDFFCQTYINLHFSLRTFLPARIFDSFEIFFCQYRPNFRRRRKIKSPSRHDRKKSNIIFPRDQFKHITLRLSYRRFTPHDDLYLARNRHRSLSIRRMSPFRAGRLPGENRQK